jgi:molybdenum cofactor cytidylyltransferase
MGRSVALGVAAARGIELDAVVIALADMPCVSAAHVLRLLGAAEGPGDVVASSSGGTRSPPALFGRAHFEALETLDGEAGARALILGGRAVVAAPEELIDIDTLQDLARLQLSQRQTPAP